MANTFELSILTPEKAVFEGTVEYVEAPGSEGFFASGFKRASKLKARGRGGRVGGFFVGGGCPRGVCGLSASAGHLPQAAGWREPFNANVWVRRPNTA